MMGIISALSQGSYCRRESKALSGLSGGLPDDEATLAVKAYVAGDDAGRLPDLTELVQQVSYAIFADTLAVLVRD
jgi:hypothetical protein